MPKEYQRLTRTRSQSGFAFAYVSRSSLWLGKDHLLCVDTTGYTENYKRFYFRDIQAITVQQTEQQHWWTGIFGFVAFVFVIFSISVAPNVPVSQWSGGAMVGEGILVGGLVFSILLLVVNLLRGPTCKCYLRTAVQVELLSPLNRVGRARNALARIRPLIVAVQGQLAPEEISSRLRQAVEGATGQVPGSGLQSDPARQQP